MRQVELEIISSLEHKKTKSIQQVVVKKVFDLDIVKLEEFINSKTGKSIRKYSSLCEDNTWYKVNKPYEQMKTILINRSTPVIGFISKSKLYGKKESNKRI